MSTSRASRSGEADLVDPPADGGAVRRRLPYMPALEGLRGFALLAELVAHLGLFVVVDAYRWLMPGALSIMSIFFVLSGFFITILLVQDYDRHGRVRMLRFWWGRARRLYPPLLLALAAHWLIVLYYQRPLGSEIWNNLWALTNMMDYRHAITGSARLDRADLTVMWSLGTEVKFYLIWPFVVTFLVRYVRKLSRIITVLAIIALGSSLVRIIQYNMWQDWMSVYFRFEGRIDAFAMGSIVAFLWYHDKLSMAVVRKLVWPCWLVFIVSFWLVTIRTPAVYTWGFIVFNVAAMGVVAGCAVSDLAISRFLSTRFMRLVGRMSYSLYLIHIQVYMWVVMERGYLPLWQKIPLALVLSAVFGTIGYLLAERWFLSKRRGRFAGTATPAVVAD